MNSMAEFSERVLELVARIPRGRVVTYGELARAAGRPRAWKAVGNAVARNPRPVEVPCHRVVMSGGAVGGYQKGPERKIRLLRAEGVEVAGGRVNLARFGFRFGKNEDFKPGTRLLLGLDGKEENPEF